MTTITTTTFRVVQAMAAPRAADKVKNLQALRELIRAESRNSAYGSTERDALNAERKDVENFIAWFQ